jgi:hypothetical protein
VTSLIVDGNTASAGALPNVESLSLALWRGLCVRLLLNNNVANRSGLLCEAVSFMPSSA